MAEVKGGPMLTRKTMGVVACRLPFLYLHPAMCSGMPTINGSRLYVQVVVDAWWAGWPEAQIYDNFPSCAGKPELLLACWWQARYGTRSWRKRWRGWLKEFEGKLWTGDYTVPLPPQREKK